MSLHNNRYGIQGYTEIVNGFKTQPKETQEAAKEFKSIPLHYALAIIKDYNQKHYQQAQEKRFSDLFGTSPSVYRLTSQNDNNSL